MNQLHSIDLLNYIFANWILLLSYYSSGKSSKGLSEIWRKWQMVLLKNISLCNVLWDWKSKSDSRLTFLNVVTIFKNSLLALQHWCCELIAAVSETGTECRAELWWGLCLAGKSEELPLWCKRGELKEGVQMWKITGLPAHEDF